MFSTGHLTSGLALGLALGLDPVPLAILVVASVFTDWDYALQLATGRNHRTFLTHCPPVVALVVAAIALAEPLAWWWLVGAMLHFSLDLLDYGLRLVPWSARVTGLRWLDVAPDASFGTYLRAYARDWRFVALEALFLALAASLAVARWA